MAVNGMECRKPWLPWWSSRIQRYSTGEGGDERSHAPSLGTLRRPGALPGQAHHPGLVPRTMPHDHWAEVDQDRLYRLLRRTLEVIHGRPIGYVARYRHSHHGSLPGPVKRKVSP